MTQNSNNTYDFAVIGAGVTGLAASMYAARLGLKTLCLGHSNGSELPLGGVITTTDSVENYPGFSNISGFELAEKIKDHAISYALVTLKQEKVLSINKEKLFTIKTEKETYTSKTILIATGTKWKKLEVPGSTEFENKGIAYCALCDGPLYKNKTVAVVGGSDSAAKDALVLSKHASKVFIIYRGEKIRAEPINLKKVEEAKNIEIIPNTNIVKFEGSSILDKVILDKPYNGILELNLNGVFIAIGHEVLSGLAESLNVNLNEKKEIIIDHKTAETNISGIYAAGDVADKPFKQAITGVAEGCTAAHSAYEYISKNFFE